MAARFPTVLFFDGVKLAEFVSQALASIAMTRQALKPEFLRAGWAGPDGRGLGLQTKLFPLETAPIA
jgi:hypothetical protein